MLSGRRYRHCVNVARSAEELALRYGTDPEKARIAGILHDITKEWTIAKHMEFIEKHEIKITKFELASKKLLHALTGSCYVKRILKINDRDIINSIKYHTTARRGMNTFEKIIYIADFISAERNFPEVEKMRKFAAQNLKTVMPIATELVLRELLDSRRLIHPNSIDAYNEAMMFSQEIIFQMNYKKKFGTSRKILRLFD
jgi:predicted HD superfamily hydrolase involved in NAD metabolism